MAESLRFRISGNGGTISSDDEKQPSGSVAQEQHRQTSSQHVYSAAPERPVHALDESEHSPMPIWWPSSTLDASSSASSSSSPLKKGTYYMLDDAQSSSDGRLSSLFAKDQSPFHRSRRTDDSDSRQRQWEQLLSLPSPSFRESDLITPPLPGDGGGGIGEPVYRRPHTGDDTLALLLPLLILLSTLLFLLLLFVVLIIVVRRRTRIALGDSTGPLDVGREEELEGHGGLEGVEQRWLETQDDATRQGYARAKDWTLSYPPGSQSTDITLSQFLSIQEKGVSAWSFDPDYESNPSVFVEARTEITFLADGEGMAPSEGGGCCVQSNLPLPKINEVYYWEAKMFNKPDGTNVALGLTTKPYPNFRMPGWSKFSIGFFSADGFKCHNYPFAAQSYGPAYVQGDVIGVGYRPRTGTVFFTRNGKRLEDAFIGLNRYNLFPTVGADGACEVHVNLGQAGFVFIEANVKKWGLAPMVGTLAPPPAYGQERGSILIETGQGTSSGGGVDGRGRGVPRDGTGPRTVGPGGQRLPGNVTPPPPISPYDERGPSTSAAHLGRSNRTSAENHTTSTTTTRRPPSGATPIRSSSLRDSSPSRQSDLSFGSPPNPPTPHRLDISLHSLNSSEGTATNTISGTGAARGTSTSSSSSSSYFPPVTGHAPIESLRAAVESGRRSPSPPPYSSDSSSTTSSTATTAPVGNSRESWMESGLGGTGSMGARRSSGRTHAIANAVLGMLGDRGLLTPQSASGPVITEDAYERDATIRNTRRNAGNDEGWISWLGFRS